MRISCSDFVTVSFFHIIIFEKLSFIVFDGCMPNVIANVDANDLAEKNK